MTPAETLKATIERLINKIESNTTPQWIKPFNCSFPSNYSSKTEYQGINILNLWSIAEDKNYSTNQWLTFNQVKALNGTIKQGEKASPVFFFKPLEIEEEETAEKKMIPMLKIYYVFNVSQTTLEIQEEKKETIEDIQSFIDSTGIEIKKSVDGAYFVPAQNYIGIPSMKDFHSTELYYATLFHELAHATGHETRLNRDFSGRMKGTEEQVKKYAVEELIAETVRAFLQVKFGLNTTEMEDQNASYLKGWLKPLKEDPKMLWKIFSEASKAFRFLTEAIEEEKVA